MGYLGWKLDIERSGEKNTKTLPQSWQSCKHFHNNSQVENTFTISSYEIIHPKKTRESVAQFLFIHQINGNCLFTHPSVKMSIYQQKFKCSPNPIRNTWVIIPCFAMFCEQTHTGQKRRWQSGTKRKQYTSSGFRWYAHWRRIKGEFIGVPETGVQGRRTEGALAIRPPKFAQNILKN